jgi:nucleotide-binding universal stress UspA family protein
MLLYASLEATRPESGAAAFAVDAAAAIDAHLDVLAPHVDLVVPGSREARTDADLDRENATRRQALASIADTIAARAAELGVDASCETEWAHAFGLVPFVGEQARLRDVVVTGVDQSIFLSERRVAEHVLFESGRPLVIVPADYKATFASKQITVAWDFSRAAARALHDALPFLSVADEVVLTAVGGEKRFQTDADPATIEAAMARKGLNARFEQIELGGRTIGQALQDQALANGAEMLVMGGFGQSRLKEFILGGATSEVLDDPRLPVLMSH